MAISTAAQAPLCLKQEYVGAVTLLQFSAHGTLLYVGVGATLYLYETSTGRLISRHDIFPRGVLHGLDYVHEVPTTNASVPRNFVVFFGQKRLVCVQDIPETLEDAVTQGSQLHQVGKPKVCGDWIFDVQILSDDARDYESSSPLQFPHIVIGFAHNYIQLWDPNTDQVLCTVLCSERCILYSLAFYGRRAKDLLVASGTVFQQVLLWSPNQNESGNWEDRVDPRQRLHGHNGVIFKLRWSEDAHTLASVSDDRTLQLWSNASGIATPPSLGTTFDCGKWLAHTYESIARSWGHTARLWDAQFCELGVVTTSEDATCKLWDTQGHCLATMQGHAGKHAWRVAVHPTHSEIIATGGGDGSVKLWNLHQQAASTAASAGANCMKTALLVEGPSAHGSTGTRGKKKAAALGVRNIVIRHGTNGADRAFVAIEDGQVFGLMLENSNDDDGASRLFAMTDLIPSQYREERAASNVKGSVSTFSVDAQGRLLLIGDSMGYVMIVDVVNNNESVRLHAFWKAHDSRIMTISWQNQSESVHTTLFTCSADGNMREWSISREGDSIALVASYKGPAKCATSCVTVIDVGTTRNLVCGDGRGNIYGFHRPLAMKNDAAESTETINKAHGVDEDGNELVTLVREPNYILRNAHGRDMVSAIVSASERSGNLMYSGGHDGYICSFLVESVPEQGAGCIAMRYVGRQSIKGITMIKQLEWNQHQELVVLGFHATYAVLHNLTTQYRLFNIECGGWRRPHALRTRYSSRLSAIPSHDFIFTPPVAPNADPQVRIHSTPLHGTANSFVIEHSSLHRQYHGRMTTCAIALGSRLLTSGEDNSVKLHERQTLEVVSNSNADLSITSTPWTWQTVSTGIAHTTTIRALTAFYLPSLRQHIVLSGGGKERVNAWGVEDDHHVVAFLCGFDRDAADQDHRILGLATFTVPLAAAPDQYRLVVACNSEGALQLLLLDVKAVPSRTTSVRSTLVEIGECKSSNKPILSCSALDLPESKTALLAVGSTDGMINIWRFTSLLDTITDTLSRAGSTAEAVAPVIRDIAKGIAPEKQILAHEMGVNCLCVTQTDSTCGTFRVLSGGDDQCLCARELTIDTLSVVREARAVNASGSAIKAITATRGGRVVYCAGYDQRLSQWTLDVRDETDAQSEWGWQWKAAAFTECADIADVEAWEGDNAQDELVVVGQGLQTVQF